MPLDFFRLVMEKIVARKLIAQAVQFILVVVGLGD